MLISEKNKFIFIHIYKNAGTSIVHALRPFATSVWAYNLNKISKRLKIGLTYNDCEPYPFHMSAQGVVSSMGKDKFKDYYSFAFVRNPWDWQISLYSYVLSQPGHYQHQLIKKFSGFDEYIKWKCSEDVRLQKDFIYSPDGELLVNKIARYESLEDDFSEICNHLGIKATLPRLNVSNKTPYQSFYTDCTIELAREAFAADIKLFGYDFES